MSAQGGHRPPLQLRNHAGAVGERLLLDTELVQQRQMQVCQSRALRHVLGRALR